MKCPTCGSENKNTNIKCEVCGTVLHPEEEDYSLFDSNINPKYVDRQKTTRHGHAKQLLLMQRRREHGI